MYKVTLNLEDRGEFSCFSEAFRCFYHGVKRIITEGTTEHLLETTNFIEYTPTKRILELHPAKELGHELGYLDAAGGLMEELPEPDEEMVLLKFHLSISGN